MKSFYSGWISGHVTGVLSALTLPGLVFITIALMVITACSSPGRMGRSPAVERFTGDPAIMDAHLGIAFYDLSERKYLFLHNGDNFFVPASNAKLATLYAGLRYLGDSIPGIRYADYNDTIFLKATGDPSLLLADFSEQPVLDFLRETEKPMVFIEPEWMTSHLGYGWPWNFYLNYYMAERSPLPVYGNVIIWAQKEMQGLDDDVMVSFVLSYPRHNWPVVIRHGNNKNIEVKRLLTENQYTVFPGLSGEEDIFIPFATRGISSAVELLEDTLDRRFGVIPAVTNLQKRYQTVYSRPSDSLFRPMMLYSDNFFAEQTLLMAGMEAFGVMDEKLLIEYLLDNELKDLPQRPRWVDGSGLSRYNLFTPVSFIRLLEKMADEFGFDRVCRLLPTGGEGTLENLYRDERGMIYAKTGTLGGNSVSLSGYLITSGGRRFIFSILVNNHNKESDMVRAATENFLIEIIRRY